MVKQDVPSARVGSTARSKRASASPDGVDFAPNAFEALGFIPGHEPSPGTGSSPSFRACGLPQNFLGAGVTR